ncbi:glycerol-3-phosphate ABC transporter ATP-binding protein [Pacificitalea manganoxidans]|uniref:Glycerol-3-phosphate ABC transporter ATP-binding protein n=1 Tax=Pacificitalea manganoxidans TaxID=1411902 RepID=A0A291LXU8_9RHOB|nr:sn-glycerol-3-phosphate ABC transporter ATP-binding protein UgpC [Pacificitalea manganoxidans]ATI41563.1 glycerol-3-phosphate ABC transporter ATP-binding protein [Pacificitalea manganoxidans]MDR6308989.1 multiple sugar transport system ATP-binding protein [Pacificitalea manganoxidans]
MASITMKNLVKRYGAATVIPELSLEIRDTEFVVLVGPSGCGKSTLLRVLAGLEPISGGELYIGDDLVNDVPPSRRDIAMVFQDYALYPHMTVRQNMGFALEMRGMPKAEIAERVDTAARLLDIGKLLDRRPKALSGGQRQRVAMGRAIVRNPRVFLFDEPLSNLDAKLRAQVRAEIKALSEKLKTTMVFVTHDQVEAMTMADRIVVLKDGEIQQVGTPEEVYNRPVNQFVAGFIGSPAMNFNTVTHRAGRLHLTDGSSQPLPSGVTLPENAQVVLGVRPEHFIVSDTDPDALSVEVTLTEPLGSETLVHFNLAGERVIATVPPDHRVDAHGRLSVRIAMDKAHLFDPETGAALRERQKDLV